MNEPHAQERHDSGHDLVVRSEIVRASSNAMRARTVSTAEIGENDAISADFVLSILRKWWRIVIPSGLVLAAASAALVMYLHVPMYEAKALISIEATAPYIAFANGAAQQSSRYVETQVELLRGPFVLGPVVARDDVAAIAAIKESADPIEHLGAHMSVRQVGRSELYEIRYVSASPADSATVANAIVAEYLNLQSEEDFQRSRRVIALLEEEQERRREEVEQRRKEVLDLAKGVTGRDPFGLGVMLDVDRALSPLAGLHQNYSATEVRREMLEAELQALRDAPALGDDSAAASGLLDLQISIHPEIRALQDRIVASKATMQEMREKILNNRWETNPQYVRLKTEVEKLEAEASQRTADLREQILKGRALERDHQRAQFITQKENELKSLARQSELYLSKFDEELSKVQDNDVASVKFEFAQAALQREERVYELIEGRKLALQTELRAPARVTSKQPATPPRRSLEPVPYKMLALSCMAAMACPLGLAVLREVTVKKVSTPDQLVQETKQRFLGEVARFPVRPVASSIRQLSRRAQQEMFVFAESIDSIRTSLMLSESLNCRQDGCVWALASAASGEGKTSVATSLAVSFGGATKTPTLIIDADLRAPGAAGVLGVPNLPGLAELLAGKATLDDVIHRVGETTTFVLPAGRIKINPHHLVDRAKIEKLLDTLRPKFPHIIIDTPPVLSASESLIYAKAADYVVYCALRDVTRARQVRAAVGRLQDAGANLAGAVLSGMPVNAYVYAYGVYGRESLA